MERTPWAETLDRAVVVPDSAKGEVSSLVVGGFAVNQRLDLVRVSTC